MRKQALIVGLGQFGLTLAKALTDRRIDVLGADQRPELVQEASSFVSEAVRFDATDEDALARTAPDRRDLCICAIGAESREASIVCTALLRQMGAKRVIARATDQLHERILRLVGAHEVVNPEKEFAQQFANTLAYQQVVGELPLGKDLVITELRVSPPLAGHSLAELALPRRFGVTIVAVRNGEGSITLPGPELSLDENDVLVLVSRPDAVPWMMEKL
jgi:trk system potassium uptake protein TrkA